ncbi:hypothetical protein NHQ30_001430 [Ciborinia camelliae]|nr:hypothetical protein NHQ30_001430 [Ciborinia camelliae]
MELRRIGTAVFRSSVRDLSFAQLFQSNGQNVIRTHITHRAFSITSRSSAIIPEPTTRAPFTSETSPSSSPSPSTPETSNASPASPHTPKEDTLESLSTESISQTLSWIKPPSRFKSSSAQLEKRATSPEPYRSSQLKSTSLLQRISNPSLTQPSLTNPSIPRFSALDSPFGKMQFPSKKTGKSSDDFMKDTANLLMPLPSRQRAAMRLSPRTGRTFDIKSNIDLSRGIRMLEASCATNKVRNDHSNQRFHERGGMKRKRLHRQRWRANFMAGFKGIVGRVKQLKNQGW